MWLEGLELIPLFLEFRSLSPELPEAFTVFAETRFGQETQFRWQGWVRRTDLSRLILTI